MTVKQMKEWLNQFNDDIPVVLNIEDKNTNSGVFISVCERSEIEKVRFEDDEEDEYDEYLVLKACECHTDEKLDVFPESINPN